jgi:hypothetical protein
MNIPILLTGESLIPPKTKLGVPFTAYVESMDTINPAFTYACAFYNVLRKRPGHERPILRNK